jgi:hypothetical protein
MPQRIRKKVNDFTGGWNTADPTIIADNELEIAKNMYYDEQRILSTRRGIQPFGTPVVGLDNFHSLYFTTFTDGTRILLAGGDTSIYRYNEATTVWDVIKTGLTADLPLSFVTFKDVIYWMNGTDNSMGYDGTTVTEYALMLKGKYIIIANDVAYTAGLSTDPSTVFYTNANPADLNSTLVAAANNEPINQDEGTITGLFKLTDVIVGVGKTNGIFSLNTVATPTEIKRITEDKYENHRAGTDVENDYLFLGDNGVFSLAQREGTTASFRSWPYTRDIQEAMDAVVDKSTANMFYWAATNNVYVAVNQGGGSVNDTLLVYSVLTSSPSNRKFVWTEYEGINATDMVEYIDSSGVAHLLYADANNPQVYELEIGFSEEIVAGTEATIGNEAKTKTFDFGGAEEWKSFVRVDIGGLISKQAVISAVITVDDLGTTTQTTKNIEGTDFATGPSSYTYTFGVFPLGVYPLGGGGSEPGIKMYPFMQQIYLYIPGTRLNVSLQSDSLNSAWKLTKFNATAEVEPPDVYPGAFIK